MPVATVYWLLRVRRRSTVMVSLIFYSPPFDMKRKIRIIYKKRMEPFPSSHEVDMCLG